MAKVVKAKKTVIKKTVFGFKANITKELEFVINKMPTMSTEIDKVNKDLIELHTDNGYELIAIDTALQIVHLAAFDISINCINYKQIFLSNGDIKGKTIDTTLWECFKAIELNEELNSISKVNKKESNKLLRSTAIRGFIKDYTLLNVKHLLSKTSNFEIVSCANIIDSIHANQKELLFKSAVWDANNERQLTSNQIQIPQFVIKALITGLQTIEKAIEKKGKEILQKRKKEGK